jgi:hypothetical protein
MFSSRVLPARSEVAWMPRRFAGTSLLAVGIAFGALGGRAALAQETPGPQADPRDLGLRLPTGGPIRRGQGQRVTMQNDADEEVVALVHADVADRRLVILPNGRLEVVDARQTKLTDEPFLAATKKEIAEAMKRNGFGKFKTRRTAHYLFVYNTSEAFAKGTSRILETMYPAIVGYFKRLKIPVYEPHVPLVAVMFRTEEEFQNYQKVPAGLAAYYSSVSNQIVMYEQSDLVEVAPELAVKQSIGTVAHEGVHQILHNIGVQQRLSRWPMWISEGLAEYFAPTSVDRRLRWKGAGQPHDLRMHELERFLKQPARQRGGVKRGELIADVVAAKELSSSGYAAAWALTHYLASRRREDFRNYVREVATLGPLEPREGIAAADPRQLFNEHFGSDYAKLEEAMIKHLQRLPYVDPVANQTHYVVVLEMLTSRRVGVTTSPASVRQWQQEALRKISATARAAAHFEIMPFANKQLAERFAAGLLRAN